MATHPPQFYGRRRGRKLRATQEQHLAWVMAHYAISPQSLAPSSRKRFNPTSLFSPPPSHLYLEIGFGGGEHLIAQAQTHPQCGFIGAEPYINGIASLGRYIHQSGIKNIRIWADDVRLFLPALPKACLDGVYVLFPDPWPKTRHAARRIIQPAMLDRLAECIKSGGFLLLASDDATAKSWLLAVACQHRQFVWQAERAADWRHPPSHIATRYMHKAAAQGRTPSWFLFGRV